MAVLTSEQDVESFLNRETVVSGLSNLCKGELLLISDHFELNFTKASKKADILAAVQDLIGVSQKEEAEEVEGEEESLPEKADPGKTFYSSCRRFRIIYARSRWRARKAETPIRI